MVKDFIFMVKECATTAEDYISMSDGYISHEIVIANYG